MIDDQTLDTLLRDSLPGIEHDPRCDACATASAPAAARRWPRRLAVAGVATGAVLVAGAGAAATVGLPFLEPGDPVQHTQTVSNGDHCYATYRIVPDGQRSSPASLAAAQVALSSLDIASLDISEEVARLNQEYADSTWEGPGERPDFFYITDSLDMVESAALTNAVFDAVRAEVRAQGLPGRGFSMETETKCDDYELAITGD